jgi:hypothetical protein
MEILETISWVALGFVPMLAVLEIYDRLRRGRKKVLKVVGKIPTLIIALQKAKYFFPFRHSFFFQYLRFGS